MKKHLLAVALVLALGTTYAASQDQAARPDASVGSSGQATADSNTKTQVDDETVTMKLQHLFDTDAAFKNVQIAVTNGQVNLTGAVASKDDSKRAKGMASAVPGVRSVREHLTVNAATGASAARTTGSTAMSETANNSAGSIAGNSDAKNASATGQSTATGTPSSSGGSMPASQAAGISGQSGTTMQEEASATATPTTSTAALKTQLDSAYQSEPTLSNSHVMANVTDTTIELTGTVPTSKERLTAKRIAQSYAGNRKVDDKLTVSGRGAASGNNPGMGQSGMSNSTDMGTGTGSTNSTTGTTPTTKDPSSNPPASNNDTPKAKSDQPTESPR